MKFWSRSGDEFANGFEKMRFVYGVSKKDADKMCNSGQGQRADIYML
jgi:hypothetical protein